MSHCNVGLTGSLGATLPPAPAAGVLEWALVSFGAVPLAQATLPLWSHHPAAHERINSGVITNADLKTALVGAPKSIQT